ncbi:MAG: glycosyltransferase [Actinomycetota bacterium]
MSWLPWESVHAHDTVVATMRQGGVSSQQRLLMVRTRMGEGGNDRVASTLLRELPRDRFAVDLAVLRTDGHFMTAVPGDVAVHSLGEIRLWRAVVPLGRLVQRLQPDVVFSMSNGTNIVAIAARALFRGSYRVVLSERNSMIRAEYRVKNWVLTQLKRLTYARAEVVTAVSEGVARELVDHVRVAPERVRVVYNPVVTPDVSSLAAEPVDHPWFAAETQVILGCGRLVPQKDFASLIRAFARIQVSIPYARLVILGEGKERRRLEMLARELGVYSAVWLAGYQTNPFKFMARSSCFVLSSRHEGLPGALIQAMACGAAVVSTDCPSGPSEIVTDGVDGLLCPVGDIPLLAGAIERVLGDRELRESLGANALTNAQRFHLDRSLGRYISALMDG